MLLTLTRAKNKRKDRKENNMLAIYKKELRSYFINPLGYIYVGIFLVLSALVFSYTTLQVKSYETDTYFMILIFALIIMIPLLTMRTFAEERKMRTEQLLLTAPISITGMVLGKFFAALTVFASSVILSCVNFIPLYAVAATERDPDPEVVSNIGPLTAEIFGCVLGLLLIGAAFIAIGIFISSLTESQLSAAVVTVAVLASMVFIGFITQIGSDALGTRVISVYAVRVVIDWLSVLNRFAMFGYGYFDFAALFYYVSLCFVFIFLTVRVYDKRRWG